MHSSAPARRSACATILRCLAGSAIAALLLLPPTSARARDVLVFAAASTTDALNAIIDAYAKRSQEKVRVSFASSSTLARQIANGAPANLFLSANEKWMDWLAERKTIDAASRRDLLRNVLVLIAPANSVAALTVAPGFALADALANRRLAIGDPDHVPAGLYAKQALTKLNVWDKVAGRTARTQDVRAALALVVRGEAPFGIVYATDAKATGRVRIVDTFPRESHPPIVYPAALVAGRDTPKARAFYAFLRSGEGRAIFSRFGFVVD